jgi:hypothetical protein
LFKRLETWNFTVRSAMLSFLFTAAEIGNRVRLKAAALASEDGVDETREKLARDPEAAIGDEGESADQLVTGFDIGEEALDAHAKQGKAVIFDVLFADYDEAGIGIALHDVGEECASGGLGSVSIDDENVSPWRLHAA